MSEWVLVPAAEVDAIVTEVAEPLLVAAGFRPGARRRWVRASPPIRHVFELAALKGASFVPRWGVSLDFVPHLKGGALAWHRTDKSAVLDLVYDPVDFEAGWPQTWAIDSLHGVDGFRRGAERVLPAAVRAACAWLDGARDVPAVLARAEWLRTAARPGGRFGFENWVQQPLALAFLLARSGAGERAREVLDGWLAWHDHPQLRDQLVALLDEVSAATAR